MIATAAERNGVGHLGIDSDLCHDRPGSVVTWMRNGRWTRQTDFGEGTAEAPGFAEQRAWFADSGGFANIHEGLAPIGFPPDERAAITEANWLRFYERSFGPQV